ncbi:diaminopimelate epimerase [Cohnella panacarvi]|uniref:diaminopimelate epimerase n=1 Tax=Cohnella panacarvi TaxID=400776 RepID=UPI00047D576D|nr:diaminopimelate epimerase [Cohnella panacarvi]
MKQEIEFVKFNPTQNMTILVKTEHPAEDYKHIAAQLMSYDNVHAEQVGFIGKPNTWEAAANLIMAGGEFCGNACMAMAVYIASENGLESNGFMEIALETSGTNQLVACRVQRSDDRYSCQVSMPLPFKVEQQSVEYEGEYLQLVIVRYEHYFHIVIEVDQVEGIWTRRAEGLARLLGVTLGARLIGILLFNPISNEMAPLIFLPELDSLIWEKGCGSGTASVGAYLSWRNKGAIQAEIKQPGGTIQVRTECLEQKITGLYIDGLVGIVARGKAFIDSERSCRLEYLYPTAPNVN